MAQTNAAKRAATSGQADRLSDLPDELLHHILGFVPAHDAVRTSVLARRWRPLWKFVRRLHIACPVQHGDTSNFVNSLLILQRERTSLDEIKFDYDSQCEEQTAFWLRFALLVREAQSAIVLNSSRGCGWIDLEGTRLFGRRLRKLELNKVILEDEFLNFLTCPALEELEISQCQIATERITSPSLKLLRIDSSDFTNFCQTRISAPSLIRFQLNEFTGTSPLLETMPLLETAAVKPSPDTIWSEPDHDEGPCGNCAICSAEDDFRGRCLLLGGLSSAVNLELTAYPEGKCLFRRDLRWCPTFSKLKNLVLYDFCVASDLFTILNRSPVLENLTLYLYKGTELPSKTEGNDTLMEKPTALSRLLKIIKIRCEDFDENVCDLLKVLTAWGTEINISRF